MDMYTLSRNWFNFSFENPEKISPNHTALYFFAIEHCNRLGGKEKFGFPTEMAKDAIGIKSYNTYIKTLNDLVEWGFIKMIERSKNQYSANIIALSKFDKALNKALDKAMIKHKGKQSESTGQSNDSIDIQVYKDTNLQDSTPLCENLETLMKQNIDIESFVLEYNSNKENILKELKAFYLYWSEKKQNGKKERWQMEKTFDIGRRFHKRMANSGKWDTGKKQNMVIVDF